MKKITRLSKFIVGVIAIVNGLYSLFNNASSCFSGLPVIYSQVYLVIFIILGAFLVVGSILDFVAMFRSDSKKITFKYQSKKFFAFFSKWYSKSGKLSIICDDLDWIKTEEHNEVFEQLMKKSREKMLILLLGVGINDPVVQQLKAEGATVASAPQNVLANYTFSCHAVMGNSAGHIIVREKRNDETAKGKLVIEEVSNRYVTELLNALLNIERVDDHEKEETCRA